MAHHAPYAKRVCYIFLKPHTASQLHPAIWPRHHSFHTNCPDSSEPRWNENICIQLPLVQCAYRGGMIWVSVLFFIVLFWLCTLNASGHFPILLKSYRADVCSVINTVPSPVFSASPSAHFLPVWPLDPSVPPPSILSLDSTSGLIHCLLSCTHRHSRDASYRHISTHTCLSFLLFM